MATGPRWARTPGHRAWLHERAGRLLEFYTAAHDPAGGFADLDVTGRPLPTGWPPAPEPQTSLFQTTRMVHVYAIAHLWGHPAGARMVEHGLEHLWSAHRDRTHGGYYWVNGTAGPLNDSKQLYGHAFVLLAASSAKLAGHPDAGRVLDDVATVIDEHFWEDGPGAAAEEFSADWSEGSDYRGANGNMHFVEALLAAYEATGDTLHLERAYAVTNRIIAVATAANGWRIPEHYRADWSVDLHYGRDVFRPYGSTIGHWLEWSRLLLQLWVARGKRDGWLHDAATTLFDKAVQEGWDAASGGFYFTVGWDGRPVDRDRYWWPCTEGIAAAYWLAEHTGEERYESAYRRIWSWSRDHLVRADGPWLHQLDDSLEPISNPWYGVPDVYHGLQATLIPTVPATGSIVAGLLGRKEGADDVGDER
jgi:mannose/cellobiose epimerase-like protein (N-acyl-D-glucosamine 2-epimerase family)